MQIASKGNVSVQKVTYKKCGTEMHVEPSV